MSLIGRLLDGIRNAMIYQRAMKLAFDDREQEALETLRKISGPPEYLAKAELMSADILYRMRKYPEAIQCYNRFLIDLAAGVKQGSSRTYLTAYATFFLENAVRNSGGSIVTTITQGHLSNLAATAAFLDKKEFPPPK